MHFMVHPDVRVRCKPEPVVQVPESRQLCIDGPSFAFQPRPRSAERVSKTMTASVIVTEYGQEVTDYSAAEACCEKLPDLGDELCVFDAIDTVASRCPLWKKQTLLLVIPKRAHAHLALSCKLTDPHA